MKRICEQEVEHGMNQLSILIGSPIRQTPEKLALFLKSLEQLSKDRLRVGYLFFDDNTDADSSAEIRRFAERNEGVEVIPCDDAVGEDYICNDKMHFWKEALIWKVAAMKDRILEAARKGPYSHVFLADSDLLFHPLTLQQLASTQCDIVSTVYWTRWQPNTIEMPQVWLHGEYEFYPLERRADHTNVFRRSKMQQFFAQLRIPGLYEVGGLGACTLISRKALEAGVRFAEVKNLGYWGEDRHFCVRAAALGVPMHVETTYPAYHIYRDADLPGARDFLRDPERSAVREPSGVPENEDDYGQGFRMLSFGYEEAAAECFERFIASNSGTVEQKVSAYLQLDASYSRRGQSGEGRRVLLGAVESLRRAELYCRIGSKCMDLEQWKEAVIWLKMAVKSQRPDNWEQSPDVTSWTWKPYIQLCVCYERMGDPRKAHEYNEKGLRFDPDHPSMLQNRQVLERQLERLPG